MRELIRHILKESKLNLELIDVIKNEDIFAAAELVGGLNNLKRILKDTPEFTSLIESLYGKLDLIYHSRKEFIEFPVKFEIVGIHNNTWDSNSWPLVNLIYDDSKFDKEEKELFDQFVWDTIADFNIGSVDIKPEARDMFEDGSYIAIDYVNGKYWQNLDHNLRYDDKDMKHLYRLYMENNKLNESRRLTENEEDPTQKILNFLRRRYKVEETNLGDWGEDPVIIKQISFDVNGQRYSISNFQNKKEQIKNIVDMLTEHNVIEPIDPYRRELDPYAQKVIRATKTFLNQVM